MGTTEHLLSSPTDEFQLACVLLSPSGQVYLGDTLEAVDPDDFSDPTLGRIWAAARRIHAEGRRVTKRSLLASSDGVANINVPAVRAKLEQISGEPVYPTKLHTSIRTVAQTAQLRRLVHAADRIKASAVTSEDYSQALNVAWEELRQLDGSELSPDVVPFSTLVDDFHKAMTDSETASSGVIPSPWPELNDLLSGGFHAGRSFVVAGRPGSGKSNGALNAAAHAAEAGFTTLVVSEEMSRLEVTERLMAAGAHVEYSEITRRDMSAWTADAVFEYGETHRDMPLYVIDRPGLTIEYVAAVARTMQRVKGLDLLVIDYLQLLDPTDRTRVREQQVAHISRSIKLLSRDLGCAIITAAQLNRENVKSNRRPTVADLRESGSIENDADAVILLHHEETDDGRPTGMITLIVAKSRFGCKDAIELRWRGHQARIG